MHLPHHAVLVHDDLEPHALARLVEALLRFLARREERAEVRVVGFAGEGEGAALGEVVFVAREDELCAGLADGLQGAVGVGGAADGAEGGEAGGEDGGGEVGVGEAGLVDVPVHVGKAGGCHDGLDDEGVGGEVGGGFLDEGESVELGEVG